MNWFQLLEDEIKTTWGTVRNNTLPLILFGAGDKGMYALKYFRGIGIEPTCFCDNNKLLYETGFNGVNVVSYEELRKRYKNYLMLITTKSYRASEIMNQIKAAGDLNKILHFCVPFDVYFCQLKNSDDMFLQLDEIQSKKDDYINTYNYFSDHLSQELFKECLQFECTGNSCRLLTYTDGNTLFDNTILTKYSDHIYVDVGAFSGNNMLSFLTFCNESYNKIIVVEPDKGSMANLETEITNKKISRIETHKIGAWNQKDTLMFYTLDSTAFRGANFFINVSEFMMTHQIEDTKRNGYNSVGVSTPVDTLDNILGENQVTILKTSALGADIMVLEGAKECISKYKPNIIVVNYGTRSEYLIDIPKYLKNLRPDYQFYLRQKNISGDNKTVFYAV